jgi:hypothetical protein
MYRAVLHHMPLGWMQAAARRIGHSAVSHTLDKPCRSKRFINAEEVARVIWAANMTFIASTTLAL